MVKFLRYPYWSLASLSTVIQADIFAIIQLIKDASRATSAASVRMAASLSACSPSRNATSLKLQSRLHIAKGKTEDALSSTHRHLDRTSYWRAEECEPLKAAAKQTKVDTISLRLEIDALNA
ncbi:uncharacterized protein MYCGRDRAFT_97710 [Zymoseptoria tritici IPO323]|uniref:Uncharacterized protein n=1 Tax=Zymoseptoria tritici (strain CBS 115943 / IPO323) TaxID=336722 RepID=F9XR48_ZYMTI|nr:uncharacterized protein MYCGRDRAFT_97710 [Zymoseptoria tritici IPO323]EGP82275.1 hypothetical protein MYCGRDRAFT_97710 [Zymoseptoria tritici IPO323]